MKLAWITDPHLNVAGVQQAMRLMAEVRQMNAGALVVSGDIGEAPDLEGWLELMAMQAGCPVYFVLGNHDFYHDSVAEVRAVASVLSQKFPNLCWLGEGDVIRLTDRTALIGHDGWGDARHGNAMLSRVMLADFHCIEDLMGLSKDVLITKLQSLGDEAAEVMERALRKAIREGYEEIKVLTHVPPFREACWHEGDQSDDEWAPYFSCKAVGDMLERVMGEHPECRVHVLCGHTHSGGEAQVMSNVRVTTGAAEYRKPVVQAPLWCL